MPLSCMKGKLMKNKVFAGVANPMKFSVCLVSMLNFANRNAENTVTIKPVYAKISGNPFASKLDFNIMYINTPGNNPKLTISAKESNCFPISE